MITKERIELILNKVADDLNITEEQFDNATKEYKKIGKWIDEFTPKYKVEIYPQGSFALGLVVKPFDREDEYDVDLVFELQEDYGISAKQLKAETHSILTKYGKYERLIEKRRCWQIVYEHCKKFHLDVIPSIKRKEFIDITTKLDTGNYEFTGSNPKGYVEWFQSKQMATYQRIKTVLLSERNIADIKDYFVRTPLQKAIQILKRHRDIMFANDKNNCKPISILITTIAARIYDHESTVMETLVKILDNALDLIESSKEGDKYFIENPVYTGKKEKENFAEKWNEHPERASAFMKWIKQAKEDFCLENLTKMNIVELGKHVKKILGEGTGTRIFNSIAEEERKAISNNELKVDTQGTLSKVGTTPIPKVHHYGKISET